MIITEELLQVVTSPNVKNSLIEELKTLFNQYFPIYKIDNPRRVCSFLAQTSHETGGYQFFTELGNKDYFKKYEPGTEIGKELGNTEPGDGYLYRGRGIIQITGRSNYLFYAKKTGEDLIANPSLASEPVIAVKIACEFWNRNNISRLADLQMIEKITRIINGGLNGLEDRKERYNKLCAAINVQ